MARLKTVRLVCGGSYLTFEVKDQGGEHHYVDSRAEYVFEEDDGSRWITVGVCAVDEFRGVVLVEFQDGTTKGINRLWVPIQSVDPGETHVFGFPPETWFPVVRVDLGNGMTAWDEKIRVVIIEKTAEAAQLEADRLNRLKGSERVIYFWQASKTVNPLRELS